jgi:hypothetical protein
MPESNVPIVQPKETIAPQPRNTPPKSARKAPEGEGHSNSSSPARSADPKEPKTRAHTKRNPRENRPSPGGDAQPRIASSPSILSGSSTKWLPRNRAARDNSDVTPKGSVRNRTAAARRPRISPPTQAGQRLKRIFRRVDSAGFPGP